MNEIFCATPGRTVSSYLMYLMKNCANVLALGEIFDKRTNKLSSSIKKFIKLKYHLSDSQLLKFKHLRMDQYMNQLRDFKSRRRQILFYKVFLGYHISFEELERHFIQNPNIAFLYLDRNFLDMYISQEKAMKLQNWTNVNTTHVKIHFDGKHFLEFLEMHTQRRDSFKALCKKYNIQFLYMTYEELMRIESDRGRLEYVKQKLKENFKMDIQIPPNGSGNVKMPLRKQDHGTLKNKVSNYDEMMTFLQKARFRLGFASLPRQTRGT